MINILCYPPVLVKYSGRFPYEVDSDMIERKGFERSDRLNWFKVVRRLDYLNFLNQLNTLYKLSLLFQTFCHKIHEIIHLMIYQVEF